MALRRPVGVFQQSAIVQPVSQANRPEKQALCAHFSPGHSEAAFIAKYDKADVLGRGGFGTVFSGYRTSDGLGVAIKVVSRKKVSSWHKTSVGVDIPFEVAALSALADVPGVVAMHDWYYTPSNFIIVMERPQKCQDLFDYISAHGPLCESLARFFFHQVVDTVIACSQRRILHRDIKDENLVIDLSTGCLKLVDFGSCVILESRGHCFTSFEGTRLYSPPEWLTSGRYEGLQAAVWSLGILLYDMVCGVAPFLTEGDVIRRGPLRWLSSISLPCRDLVERCLTYSTESRCTLESIAVHSWMTTSRRAFVWPAAPSQGNENACGFCESSLEHTKKPRKKPATRTVTKFKSGAHSLAMVAPVSRLAKIGRLGPPDSKGHSSVASASSIVTRRNRVKRVTCRCCNPL